MASLKSQVGCWLHERPRAEIALRLPAIARGVGCSWLDLCNRHERLAFDPTTDGRICLWDDSSLLTVARVAPRVGGRLLQCCLGDWPIEFADRVPRRASAPKVSFILPVGGIDRLEQFRLALASVLGQYRVPCEVIVVEHSAAAQYREHVPDGVRYIHLGKERETDAFNKSWAMNVAVRAAQSELLILLDADMLAPRDLAARVLATMGAGALESWRFGRLIFHLPEAAATATYRERSLASVSQVSTVVQNTPMPIAVRRDAYCEIGGHDETFLGWGGEDVEFLSRLRTRRHAEGGVAPLVHVWHPAAPKKASGDRNNRLMLERLSLPTAQRISELTARPWGSSCESTPGQLAAREAHQ